MSCARRSPWFADSWKWRYSPPQTVEQYRDAMADALEGVERLSNIVRALLMLSQAESGQLVLQKTEIDLAELVRDLVDQHQIPAEARGRPAFGRRCPRRCT